MRKLYPLVLPLATAALTLAGCAGKSEAPDPSAVPFEVTNFAPDLRGHHTSWGHAGRGGAALRKPAYQPVLGSPDMLETRSGKLHPELQMSARGPQATVEVPTSMLASKCADPNIIANREVVQVFAQPATDGLKQITTMANDKGSVNEYIRVRDKLCQGATRLTYVEWEILVEGTPKDLPLHLQNKSFTSKP